MSGKTVCLSSVMVALLSLGMVHGQDGHGQDGHGVDGAFPPAYQPGPTGPDIRPFGSAPAEAAKGGGTQETPWIGPSEWMMYPRACHCTGPVGGNGPITWDIYLRSGASFPLFGSTLARALGTGWDVEGGGRLLLFNKAVDAAWVVDLAVGNIYYDAVNRTAGAVLINLVDKNTNQVTPAFPVTFRDLNMTFVTVGGGREWYLWGCAEADGTLPSFRVGVDGGGRYGSDKLEVHEIPHRTGRVAGAFLGAHADVEYPNGPAFFFAGLRAEWAYFWTDIINPQYTITDIQTINVLLTFGVRW